MIDDRVTSIDPGFAAALAAGGTLEGRRILLATGLVDDLPDIPDVRERWGRDLLHCPYCHGWEVRDQPLGVLGPTPSRCTTRSWFDSGPMSSTSLTPRR